MGSAHHSAVVHVGVNRHSPQQDGPGRNLNETIHSKTDERNASCDKTGHIGNQPFEGVPRNREIFEPSPPEYDTRAVQNCAFAHWLRVYARPVSCLSLGLRPAVLRAQLSLWKGPKRFEKLCSVLSNREKDGGDLYLGRKLARLLRKAGFKVEQMTASYEVISDLLKNIGPSLTSAFSTPGTLQPTTSRMILYSSH